MRPMPKTVSAIAPIAQRRALPAMLPLYALAVAGAGALTARLELGAWPLLIALACPLLHLVMRRD